MVFFFEATFGGGAFFVQDVMVQNYPFREFCARALKAGQLPLWNPDINFGFPLLAEGQAGFFYPFNLLAAYFLPTYAALSYNIVFHLWLAAVGTYLYLRTLECGRPAALLAALTFGLGGYIVTRGMSPNFVGASAWLPFLFLAIELSLQRRRWRPLLIAAVVAGLQFLVGHPQAAVYSLGAALLYGLYRGWQCGVTRTWWAALVFAVPLLGLLLAAAQLVPTAELVASSSRGQGVSLEQFVNMSLPPQRLVSLFLPDFFGNSSTGSYWGRPEGFYIQLCAYVGVLPLVLALAAWVGLRDRYTAFFGGLCAVALLLALGKYSSFFSLLHGVPGLSFFRIPTRFLLWLAFGVSVLAGLGFEQVLRGHLAWRGWGWKIVVLSIAFCGVMAWQNRAILRAADADLSSLSQARKVDLVAYKRDLSADLGRAALMLLVGGLVVSVRGPRAWRQGLAWAVPLLVYADHYSFGHRFNGTIAPEAYLATPATAQAILADRGQGRRPNPRVLSLVTEENSPYDWHGGWALDQKDYLAYPATLRMYTGGLYGVSNTLPGWSPLHLQRQWEYLKVHPTGSVLAGVEYYISYQPLSGAGMELIFDRELRVYRSNNKLPRAYIAAQSKVITARDQRLRFLKSASFSPLDYVVLEEPGGVGGGGGRARLVEYGNRAVEIELEDNKGGFLVLSDTHYPGWKSLCGWGRKTYPAGQPRFPGGCRRARSAPGKFPLPTGQRSLGDLVKRRRDPSCCRRLVGGGGKSF